MVERCTVPTCNRWEYYGGRGIKVCERWLRFENFFADMGKKPSRAHSIERTDNNGNYEPGNCRWATQTEQGRNTRKTRFVTFGDQRLAIGDWADKTGISIHALRGRLNGGWSVERALTTPMRK